MPAICIDLCTHLKSILEVIDFLPPHKWLISDLDCYDYCNWDGCEKWAERLLILTDEELKKDVYLRDMQFVWGVFSAIPESYDNEEILRYELPYCENSCYNEDHIVPQHPLALLEIVFFDSSFAYISSHNEKLLNPFFSLPFDVTDMENRNQTINP